MPPLPQDQRFSIGERMCCCVVRLIFIALVVLFFFYLWNLQIQILKQLDEYKQDDEIIFARIDSVESQLRGLENVNKITSNSVQVDKTNRSSQNAFNDCKTEVLSAIKQYYSEDKTGQPDYALESAGGRILRVQDTEEPKVSWWSLSCDGPHGPRQIINPGMLPGQCWAFEGSHATAVIMLTTKIKISSVSLEHVPETISHVGDINSAPRDFSIWGLTSAEGDGEHLGSFIYDVQGSPLQLFKVTCLKMYDMIKFVVSSNHGNPHFTCVYRLRVHGVRS